MSKDKFPDRDNLVKELADLVGPSFVTAEDPAMEMAGFQSNMHPEVLVYPGTRDEVLEIVTLARTRRLPLIPIGGGTRIGQVLTPFRSGIGISLKRMDRVLELEPDNLSATVEAGVLNDSLQPVLREKNIFLPVPAEFPLSTIGGEVAGNYSSWKRYRYGNIRDYVLGLTFVTPKGTVVKTGGKTVKNASGYDFTKLLAGSWGTLGIILSVTLKLKPLPEKEVILQARYPSPQQAVAAGSRITAARASVSSFNIYRRTDPDQAGQTGCYGAVVLEGGREAVDSHLNMIRSLMGDLSELHEGPEQLSSFRQRYLETRRDVQRAGSHMVVFDKRLTRDMAPVLTFLESERAAYDFDSTAGVLAFSLPATVRLIPGNFKEKWDLVVKDLKDGVRTSFDGQRHQPLLKKLYARLDPMGLMFPDNALRP